ncbi:hypothetical protein Xvie_02292 [Xenorhabdus vietnamensis]|uniref:Phosphatidylinositol diacylglycerol-lyase n=1 Tax=Xenorhabdus vietnamensis TaxID=351656 RepID=A0A1Y2SB75_9GAMM|nr:hypothetical protein [Xenorhabdus vietnamensis]OTA15955.1 hypothetical protein Xvie_02292 [Xenorhabdus vietnamensis]
MNKIINLILVNSTNSVWKKTLKNYQNVDVSNFPESIKSKKDRYFSISYDDNNITDCNFEIKYQIMDSQNNSFIIRGRYKIEIGRFDLEIYLDNLETRNHKKDSIVSLAWKPNELVHFFLIGDAGNYIGPDINTESWMQDHRNILGELPINKLCIPGSHDAGMSAVTWKTFLAAKCNTLTQSNNVLGQLKLGIRYFDIRPVLSDGEFFTGHYRNIAIWEGANGESIKSIIDGINLFTESHNELIIIRLDHSLNLDVGLLKKYRPFNQKDWFVLFDQLANIKHLYYHNGKKDISESTLNTLTNDGTRPAVLFFIENKKAVVDLGKYKNAGFFYLSELGMYHLYSNTNSVFQMGSDQIKKMNDYSPKQYFELSWILTQSPAQATTCATTLTSDIKHLANEANDKLVTYLHQHITDTVYPNIILIDNVRDTVAATFSLAINWRISSSK